MNNSNENNQTTKKTYWKSPEERDGLELPILNNAPQEQFQVSRRTFLEATGFAASLTALSGCDSFRAPVEKAHPFAEHPEGVRPGNMQYYASTCSGCSAGCGLLVGVRDGRPLKMEGMPEHPLSQGGLCAVGQALPLELYDSQVYSGPIANHKEATWNNIDEAIKAKLKKFATEKGAIRFVTNSVTSPTLKNSINQFLKQYPGSKHITFDSFSNSAILDSHKISHGERLLPHFHLDKAKVIVSLDADFLGNWISPVEFTSAWKNRRKLPYLAKPDHGHDDHGHDEHASADKNEHGKEDHAEKKESKSKEGEHKESVAHKKKEESHPKPAEPAEMSYHVHFESRMTLTGTKADKRYAIMPEEQGLILSHLFIRLAKLAGKTLPEIKIDDSPVADNDLNKIADRLWKNKGESIIISGSQNSKVQLLVNHINELLENYGSTVDIDHPSNQSQGNDQEVQTLISEIKEGKISGLFVAGVDLIHNLPADKNLEEAISSLPLVVSFSERENATTALSKFVCPDLHSLESWKDAEPVEGLYSLYQPVIHKLRNSRSILESLSIWSGQPTTALNTLRVYWKKNIFSQQKTEENFVKFWDKAVHDGFIQIESEAKKRKLVDSSVRLVTKSQTSEDQVSLVLYNKIGIPDSRHAHNPWLQELPDPITKVTWDNYVSISSHLADQLNVVNGDVVKVTTKNGKEIELSAFVQPGQHKNVIAISLGYGVVGTDRFEKVGPQWLEGRPTLGDNNLIGVNASSLIQFSDNLLSYTSQNVKIKKTGKQRFLATTQFYDSIEIPDNIPLRGAKKRDIIQETTLEEYLKDPTSGTPAVHHHSDEQLWPEDHPKEGYKWGMVIDLNSCTGCSACLIACQSENNVPVVGRDEVHRHREMHWIRIDRYYAGEDEDLEITHQPMMCHHCDNAPCETVCPVLATVHSEEGLNQQVYNRCVGTRYCANNCPYKVRRFNWFNYAHDDQLQNLALNPDVTVRMRGIMEKCSFCVQRIQNGKNEAGLNGQELADGAIQTACQQSCPADAIVFGDLNNQKSVATIASNDARAFSVLEELNVQPSISYMRQVRNKIKDGDSV